MPQLNTKIFNTQRNYHHRSLFLGDDPGLFDTVNKQHPEIWALYKELKSLDWDENEFDYSSCNVDFKTCDRSTYEMMLNTLTWQWESDSVASRSIIGVMAPFITSSELSAAWTLVSANECLTGDHEVLTPQGWKRIDQVTMDDKVAQWDNESRAIDFVHPQDIIAKEHKGVMYHFMDDSRNVSQVVTPNHRMPLVYPYWTNDNQPAFRYAEEIKYHGGNGLPNAGLVANTNRRMTPRERLWVAVQADGSLCSDKYTGTRTGTLHYRFNLSKGRKIQRLLALCEAAGWRAMELSTSPDSQNRRTFYVYVPVEDYNSEAKTFDWFNLDEVGYEWIVDFLEEIRHWDGNTTPIGRTRYITSNRPLAEKVATLAHLVGYRAHITVIPARDMAPFPQGREHPTKEAYQVYLTPRAYIPGNSIKKEMIDYEGMVYCLTVPTSFFMIRHNGAISITGNCVHSAAYSEIVRNSFDRPQEIIAEVLAKKESLNRLSVVTDIMGRVHEVSHDYAVGRRENNQDTYNHAFLFTAALLMLERIQFMASFAVTFTICDTGLFQPIGKCVQKIAQDEFEVHVELDKAILTNELQTERGQRAYQELRPLLQRTLDEVVASELHWIDHGLFVNGNQLVGQTPERLKKWVLYNAADVYRFLRLDAPYELPTQNPLLFMNRWLNISKTQPSPQEEQNGQYRVNIMRRTDSGKTFDVDF